jgi:hypothetical protein
MQSKNKCVMLLAAALVAASLTSGCKTTPPPPPVCDGKAKKPINFRAVAGAPAATKGESDGGSCGRS